MSTEKRLNARLIQKHDVEANWITASNNGFVPLKGEIIIYDKEDANSPLPEGRTERIDYVRLKIGDGETLVGNLDFLVPDITTITTAEIDEICAASIYAASEVRF